MNRCDARIVGTAMILCGCAVATLAGPSLQPELERGDWESRIRSLAPAPVDAAFVERINRVRGVIPHVQSEADAAAGGSIWCASYSGRWYDLDPSWSLLLDESPPPGRAAVAGVVPRLRVVGLDDLREQVPLGLFEAVIAIHRCARPFASGDPVHLVRAVNTLHALGEQRALQALDAYVRLCDANPCAWEYRLNNERVFPITHLLFVQREGNPEPRGWGLGAFWPVLSDPPGAWPLRPLHVEADIPFNTALGAGLEGVPESARERLDYCRERCTLRAQPLAPSANPIDAIESLTSSDRWPSVGTYGPAVVTILRQQAREALGNVVGRDEFLELGDVTATIARREAAWKRFAALVASRHPVWSIERQDFVATSP